MLDADLPSLVQLDVSPLSGLLAERLIARVPYLEKVFFINTGAEAVEIRHQALHARRPGAPGSFIASTHFTACPTARCQSMVRTAFRTGFEPLLPGCVRVPF